MSTCGVTARIGSMRNFRMKNGNRFFFTDILGKPVKRMVTYLHPHQKFLTASYTFGKYSPVSSSRPIHAFIEAEVLYRRSLGQSKASAESISNSLITVLRSDPKRA